ncbi:OmpA family protein [Portibacter marinus]|uniref:OmpA family protein n=1 Tax=Portibacter marinus TaxID=2898660 RepID=UPI001F3E7F8C|nr:OmpA family protein [Portibacter marinus]
MNSYLKIILLLTLPLFAIAQPLKEVPLQFMLDAADEALENNDYYNALEWYEQAYREERDYDLAILIADLNMLLRDYKRAESWYDRVLKRDKEMEYIDERFYYGQALKALGRYNDAYAEFQFFIDSSDLEELKPRARLEMEGMTMSSSLDENNDVVVRLLDRKVNSAGPEYGAAEYQDGTLYFSSFQSNKVIILDGKEEVDAFAKIYTTQETDKGYDKAKALPASINRDGFHSGNVTFTPDGRRMFFTRSTLLGEELATSKLYVSDRSDSGWSPPLEVESLNGDFLLRHPAVGELYGNDVLFFSANMEGGEGGFDLYYATIEGDGFATPVNLGETVNTGENEITPFYTDGVLYFSSDGYASLGGYDIYRTSWNGSEWSEIENIGLGYNTPLDDMYFTSYNGGQKGYLISNRPNEKKRNLKSKTCCDDIYSFGIRQLIIDLIAVAENEEGPMKGAEVTLVDLSGEAIDPITKTNENLDQYTFLLDSDKPYKLVFRKEGYYPDSLEFNTVGILDDFTINKSKLLKPIPVEPVDTATTITEIVTINQAIRLDNIYYDLDDDKILPDAEKDLQVLYDLLEKYPDMVIELSSHTDAQGVASYNQKLSQRRAESAKNWLVDRGVEAERIQTVGYGESQILNRCVNGVRCPDEEHRVNRRTEFKILEGPQSIEIQKEVPKELPGNSGKQAFGDSLPLIKIYNNNLDLGKVRKGEVKELEFTIENVGNAELAIEIITTCHCTELDYSTEPLAPGQRAVIKAKYNSGLKEEAKEYREVINIISNVEHIVDEAVFTVEVIE